LRKDGIVAMQIGDAGKLNTPPDIVVADFINSLDESGFKSIMEYEDMHGRLPVPCRYVVAMKDKSSRTRWFLSEAEISLLLHKRIMRDMNGELPLRHFDGASMLTYRLPSRVAEERFCRGTPEACTAALDPETINRPLSFFEIKLSSVGGGRGVYALHDISAGDYLAIEDMAHSLFISPSTHKLIFMALKSVGVPSDFWHVLGRSYIDGYGFQDSFFVSTLLWKGAETLSSTNFKFASC
jgi:hypothetical protein